jgi:hypothetical protein
MAGGKGNKSGLADHPHAQHDLQENSPAHYTPLSEAGDRQMVSPPAAEAEDNQKEFLE